MNQAIKPGPEIPSQANGLPQLSVVVPTFNERDNVTVLYRRLEATLAGIPWEVVFVDDNSPDGTWEVVRGLAQKDSRVRCIRRIGRRGLSGACIEGILAASAPYAAVIDIDPTKLPKPEEVNGWLENIGSSSLIEKQKAQKILLRPGINLDMMIKEIPKLASLLASFDKESLNQASIQVKYEIYIEKEKDLVQKMSQLEGLEIPEAFDYKKIASLGNEAMEKLIRVRPRTLGQASRISGINPSDVQILMVYMGR